MLVGQLKKTNYNTKIIALEKKITDHDHGKYITTSELNTLATNVVNTKITQANLVTKTNFDNEVLIVKLLQINQKMSLLKINYKN